MGPTNENKIKYIKNKQSKNKNNKTKTRDHNYDTTFKHAQFLNTNRLTRAIFKYEIKIKYDIIKYETTFKIHK